MKQRKEFNELVKPLMEYLANPKMFHPHYKIMVDSGRAEVLEECVGFTSDEFIKD